MMEKIHYKKYCIIGVIAAAVCLFVMRFDSIIEAGAKVLSAAAPLLLGMVIAYVLNILLKKIEKYYFPKSKNQNVIKSRRPICIVLAFLALFLIMFFIVYLVVPELVSSIRLITQEIPVFVEELRLWAIQNFDEMPTLQESLANLDIDWQETLKKVFDLVMTGAGGFFTSVVSVIAGLFGTVTQFLIGTIFAIYLLSSKERLAAQVDGLMRAYLKPQTRAHILYMADTVNQTFSSFIVGQVTEAVVIGMLCALGMLLLRMPYAVMTGTVVGVTALIPVVGAYIGAAVGAFMVFTVNPVQAVVFVVFLVILQQLEGNLIYPKVVGSSIGLPGIWVLAAVTVGGGVLGIGGMLLGVPLTASVYRLLGADVKTRIERKEHGEKEKRRANNVGNPS
ncbi:MAG: AI-2E family transporter [Lachnospiraceae bacterium]|nr:AI-2E family transporter [Lachnospiraceae bacterium]